GEWAAGTEPRGSPGPPGARPTAIDAAGPAEGGRAVSAATRRRRERGVSPQMGSASELRGTQDRSWKPRPGRDRAQISREQDRAAGGAALRLVDTDDGRSARASVVLDRSMRTGRVRATLRWRTGGRTTSVRLGEVDRATRSENLREGWRLAREAGLLSA